MHANREVVEESEGVGVQVLSSTHDVKRYNANLVLPEDDATISDCIITSYSFVRIESSDPSTTLVVHGCVIANEHLYHHVYDSDAPSTSPRPSIH